MFGVNIAIGLLSAYVLLYGLGHVVERYAIKVNYTRKIYHFFLIFYGLYSWKLIPYDVTSQTDSLWGLLSTLSVLVFMQPVRNRVGIVARMFRAIDRPEDRPYTLVWIITQLAGTFAAVVFVSFLLSSVNARDLLGIPTLIVAFGDGLAEPVGVRFGRHRYAVNALFTDRTYTRSLEGSACVLIAGFLAVFAHQQLLTPGQFAATLVTIPPLLTVAEARSPHTWDAPFMFLAAGVVIFGILSFVA